jgi:hypothetical protein
VTLEFVREYLILAKNSASYSSPLQSQSAIRKTKYNGNSRHLYYRYNIINYLLSNRIISIDYIKFVTPDIMDTFKN